MRNLAEQFAAELKAANGQKALVEEERADMEIDIAETIASAENKHNYEMSQREAVFQTKIMQLLDKFKDASNDLHATREDWASRHATAEKEHNSEVHRLNVLHKVAMSEAHEGIRREQEAVDLLRKKLGERLLQGAEEAEGELEGVKAFYRARVGAQRDAGQQFKIENGIMRKRYGEMKETLDALRSEKVVKEARCAGMRKAVEGFEMDIASLKGFSMEKDALMVEKEGRICT